MQDITAILVNYSDKSNLHKALHSLEKLSSRISSAFILTEDTLDTHTTQNKLIQHEYISIKGGDLGQTLNETIQKVSTPYLLFLQSTDYLSPTLQSESLNLPHPKAVLNTFYYKRDITIHRPILVLTSVLKEKPFYTNIQLPFKEALFPAWLSNIEPSLQLFNEKVVRQSRIRNSANVIEKEKLVQKYQLQKSISDNPTISVLISNYNMGKYVETAVVSCLLQKEPFEQILIIDDGSTDNSFANLLQWNKIDHVQVFRKENGGKARALNQLLPYVKSDFILELDADDWLDPDAASVIKEHLSDLTEEISVLYGNLRKWKQVAGDVLFKRVAKGRSVSGKKDLLRYRFPLGPRIYRTYALQGIGGFPVLDFEDGRLYEDVSVLSRLIKSSASQYHDFTVYNVREHGESITKNNDATWKDFLRSL
ncbi:glycosyltransferase family 2 protein [Radiobacillus kanasensis]|uniref:glycosyltransferase family 2 protein n=1 Tax=Radiobacillus kanasensis TaxID=2844358 RepID=UPI001E32D6F4|nr:glycosyltransferase family 2 protein [Radiobacillus kanasensis]UFU00053.1 glycosyltransferase family 2 protein [Radiobacillus kanasensis]